MLRTSSKFSHRRPEKSQSSSLMISFGEYGVHPYSNVDARLSRAMSEGRNFSVVGQNLLRPSHPDFGGDPGPLVGIKRTVFASISWTR
jgi:hypothetical protein